MFVYTGVRRQQITVQYQWWMQRWWYSDFCWCWCWCSRWRRNVYDDDNEDEDDEEDEDDDAEDGEDSDDDP